MLLIIVAPAISQAAYTEFYCNPSTGSNLNGGSGTGSPTATDAGATYERDSGAGGLDRITASTGTPFSSVSVGEFVGVKSAGGSAPADFVCRVTAVNSGGASIDVNDAASGGTRPSNSASVDVKVGGAWQGPNGSVDFPLDFATGAMTNASGDHPRINLKNNASYSISSAITTATAGPMLVEGYSTTPGDGEQAVIDGSTNAIILLNAASNYWNWANLSFQSSASSGTNVGVLVSGIHNVFRRTKVTGARGSGFSSSSSPATIVLWECEVSGCNTSNNANHGGVTGSFDSNSTFFAYRSYIHDNNGDGYKGSRTTGFISVDSIVESNTGSGISTNGVHGSLLVAINSDLYNNGESGLDGQSSAVVDGIGHTLAANSNLVKNAGHGAIGDALGYSILENCGFGAGTQANTSGATSTIYQDVSPVIYAADATPWVDPANGDFRINLGSSKGKGRGEFLGTTGSGSPDIGAQDAFPFSGSRSREVK